MAVFFRGAGVGTYWHLNDARIRGFVAQSPGNSLSVDSIKRHIRNGTTVSAFISMTRSYEIAWTYALYCGYSAPTATTPAYVYEIEIDTPALQRVEVLDPIREIVNATPPPLAPGCHYYQHDGAQDLLIGLVDFKRHGKILKKGIRSPMAGATPRSAIISEELETMVRALRDAELLAARFIPQACIVNRYEVY